MATPAELVASTLAPAFLVSGSAVFLNFCQNRLFRVVDRIRATDTDPETRLTLLRRARILRNAIVFGALAISLTLLTALGLLLGAVFAEAVGGYALGAFGLGMVSLVLAAGFAVFDTVLSVRSAEAAARRA